MRHVNIPVFIPHLGCPQLCVFCDQKKISGTDEDERGIYEYARRTIENAAATLRNGDDAEIAFFGGSFTGIGTGLMISLLDLAEEFVRRGTVSSIRLSTRPDYISEEILGILSRYSVKHIEIGVQSMSDEVLKKCRRGHTSDDSRRALTMIKKHGFEPVGQMMTGLPGADPGSETETAREIIRCGATASRIYPIVIFGGTELERMVQSGEYVPLAQDELVSRTADVLEVFVDAGIPVIKIGLHSGPGTSGAIGAYHPAMGELAEGLVFLRRILRTASGSDTGGRDVTVYVPEGFVSKATGQRGIYRDRLIEEFLCRTLRFREKEVLRPYEFDISIN